MSMLAQKRRKLCVTVVSINRGVSSKVSAQKDESTLLVNTTMISFTLKGTATLRGMKQRLREKSGTCPSPCPGLSPSCARLPGL